MLALTQGMMSLGASGGGGGDPDFASVVALLHFDGTNGSTTFADVRGLTWTANGNAQLSTTNPRFGTACLLLDGSGDFALTSTPSGFEFGTGDFTVEAWIRPANVSAFQDIFSNRSPAGGGMTFRITDSGFLDYFPGNAPIRLVGSTALTANVYTHVAVSRASGTTRLFIGGALDGSLSDSFNYAMSNGQSTDTAIGRSQLTASQFFDGRIDEMRVTKGVGRYTASFTPPTSPFPDS